MLDATNLTPLYASQSVTPIIIGPNSVNFSLSDLSQVYDGSPRAVTVGASPAAATYSVVYEPLSGATCPATADGNATTTAPTNAGSYCVYVSATGNYSGSASGTLVVAKAAATVSIDGANGSGEVDRIFNGNPQTVTGTATATPAPTGAVSITYDGDPSAPIMAGSYSLLATLNDPNYTGSATGTLVVATQSGVTINLDAATLDVTFRRPAACGHRDNSAIGHRLCGDLRRRWAGTAYPLTLTPPTAVGQYHVVATTNDPNYDTVSASGTLTIDPVDASLTLGGDPVGAVTVPATAPLYTLTNATTHVSGQGAAENVLAHLLIGRGGGATAGDLDIDYLAATQETPTCVAALPAGFWCPLPLLDNGDGTLGASFGPPVSGFPLTDGATSFFRTAYHRGGQYQVTVSVAGVSTGEVYASASQTIQVAELVLQSSGPGSAGNRRRRGYFGHTDQYRQRGDQTAPRRRRQRKRDRPVSRLRSAAAA